MKKIIVAFDGANYPETALQFLVELNNKNPILAVGAFMPQTTLSTLWIETGGSANGPDFIPYVAEDVGDIIRTNVRHFENFCTDHNIEYRVHRDFFDFTIQELKKESRFADLVMICSGTFYAHMGDDPNVFLTEALREVECPVIVLPEEYSFPTANILAYDGTASSVYSIKMFAYLFPELATNPTTIVYADRDFNEPIPDALNIHELAARHFDNLTLFKLPADPKKYFGTWLLEHNASIVVCGAYGGRAFSRLFHKSFSIEMLKEQRLPVFIAHNR
ncbi:hypothetical protein [Pollutibacter soli]|uniref:hypothetical protein n=1 Tax=Pollutibacter soli TaxID=3034157 RepID=UPI00301349CA